VCQCRENLGMPKFLSSFIFLFFCVRPDHRRCVPGELKLQGFTRPEPYNWLLIADVNAHISYHDNAKAAIGTGLTNRACAAYFIDSETILNPWGMPFNGQFYSIKSHGVLQCEKNIFAISYTAVQDGSYLYIAKFEEDIFTQFVPLVIYTGYNKDNNVRLYNQTFQVSEIRQDWNESSIILTYSRSDGIGFILEVDFEDSRCRQRNWDSERHFNYSILHDNSSLDHWIQPCEFAGDVEPIPWPSEAILSTADGYYKREIGHSPWAWVFVLVFGFFLCIIASYVGFQENEIECMKARRYTTLQNDSPNDRK